MKGMQTIASIERQNSECSVALGDLPVEFGRMRQGELYWISIASAGDSAALIRQVLAAAPARARMALICSGDPSGFLEALPADEGPGDIRAFRLRGETPKALRALAKDLDRSLRPRGRTIVLSLPIDGFPPDEGGLRDLLASWRRWLQGNGCSLLLLAHGEAAKRYADALSPLNDVLSGVACLEPGDADDYAYKLMHWRNASSVSGPAELRLGGSEAGFTVTRQRSAPVIPGSDRNQFYIERAVLEGAPVFMAEDWHVFDTSAAVFERALQANAATVVFGLGSDADVPALAKMLHALRSQRGPALKLVVRAMQRGLRYQDEQLLLACGATLIIPSDIAFPHFFSLLESVQGQTYKRELVSDPDAVIERYRSVHMCGVVDVPRFLAYLEPILSRPDAPPGGVLLAMKPVPGLAPGIALDQLRLRRLGDLACEQDGMIYLFLQGCHPHMVEAALANVFQLPYREIFSDHAVYATAAQIQNECLNLQAENHNGGLAGDAQPSAARDDGRASRPGMEAAEKRLLAYFEPKLCALPLKG